MKRSLVALSSLFTLTAALAACTSSETASSFAGSDAGSSPRKDSSDPSGETAPTYNAGSAGDVGTDVSPGDPVENDWVDTAKEATSTFGVDVDTASYSIMRRDLAQGRLPAQNTVRPEEFTNYFSYAYPQPEGAHPFSITVDGAPSKFGEGLHLLRIGLQGKTVHEQERKPANLVFLVDVSGSMDQPNKLPLVKYTLKQLVKRLAPTDTLAIVTYAGSEAVLLQPLAVTNKATILDAIDGLTSAGGTNGEGGIRKAYELAERAKVQGGINRVVLCTDGDFNVGATGEALVKLVEAERDKGVTLTTLGFGQGNYNDKDMQELADRGNGNYAFIDTPGEANRALGEKLVSTLQVIAKDVKIQVSFDAATVTRYRLVGYENRVMANDDFADDTKDSGELGAGHSVTAFYEVELAKPAEGAGLGPKLADVKLRYKQPEGDLSTELAVPFATDALAAAFDSASSDLRFAAGVVEYAEILRHSKHSQGARFDDVLATLRATAGAEKDRLELIPLVEKAKPLYR